MLLFKVFPSGGAAKEDLFRPSERVQVRVLTEPSDVMIAVRRGDRYDVLGPSPGPFSLEANLLWRGADLKLNYEGKKKGYIRDCQVRIHETSSDRIRDVLSGKYPYIEFPSPGKSYKLDRVAGSSVHLAASALILLFAAFLHFGLVLLRRKKRASPAPPATVEDLETAMHPHLGLEQRILGEYLLEEKLGVGGMAAVYLARKAEGGGSDPFAVKILDPSVSEDEEFVPRFRREVNIMRVLQHPNIVSIYDWGEERGLLYLVMEYVEGESLRKKILPGGLALAEAARYAREILLALDYAHRKGIIHRDLKPENILLTGKGKVKVADFGLGKRVLGSALTATGAVLGTPAYLPPEQFQSRKVDHRADLYSFGLVFYELIRGELPFSAADPIALLMMHSRDAPRPLREGRQDIPPALERTLMKLLSKKPEDRHLSAGEVLLEIEELGL
ncbi:MAG: serine/threonine protein kinase [Armatimonadetes bacterium]|nr:serine/threonine protein kinase [Armatimonadota bacterium]